MRFLSKVKDGGPNSPVDAYFLVEIKSLFSIALLKFNKGGREAYHSHALNALTWFLKGNLCEEKIDGDKYRYRRSILPKYTPKDNCHRVRAAEDSWCLTIRGPWSNHWYEYDEKKDITTWFTHGRRPTIIYKGKPDGDV